MANIFSKHVGMLLRRMGDAWTGTDTNGELLSFFGILDDYEDASQDAGGNSFIQRSVLLTVETCVAKQFTRQSSIITDCTGTEWLVIETMKADDGALTRCVLVEVDV